MLVMENAEQLAVLLTRFDRQGRLWKTCAISQLLREGDRMYWVSGAIRFLCRTVSGVSRDVQKGESMLKRIEKRLTGGDVEAARPFLELAQEGVNEFEEAIVELLETLSGEKELKLQDLKILGLEPKLKDQLLGAAKMRNPMQVVF